MGKHTDSKYNLVADAKRAGQTPNTFAHASYTTWRTAREALPKRPSKAQTAAVELLHAKQLAYRAQYQEFLKAQRARLGAKRNGTPLGPIESEAAIAKRIRDRASAQRVERTDIAPADPERFAIEQGAEQPSRVTAFDLGAVRESVLGQAAIPTPAQVLTARRNDLPRMVAMADRLARLARTTRDEELSLAIDQALIILDAAYDRLGATVKGGA